MSEWARREAARGGRRSRSTAADRAGQAWVLGPRKQATRERQGARRSRAWNHEGRGRKADCKRGRLQPSQTAGRLGRAGRTPSNPSPQQGPASRADPQGASQKGDWNCERRFLAPLGPFPRKPGDEVERIIPLPPSENSASKLTLTAPAQSLHALGRCAWLWFCATWRSWRRKALCTSGRWQEVWR